MAENEIVENIELKLETNFDSELNRSLATYSAFQKKAGSVSRSLESNINAMYRRVSSGISSMIAETQNSIKSSISHTRSEMRKVQNESAEISKTVENFINKTIELQKKLRQQSAFIMKDKKGTQEEKQQSLAIIDQQARDKVIQYANELHYELGEVAKNSSRVIHKSAQDTMNSISALISGTRSQLGKVANEIESNKSVSSVLKATDVIKDHMGRTPIDEKLKQARIALKEQAKLVVAADQEVQRAREAMIGQTDAKLLEKNKRFYQQAVENATKVQQVYIATEKQIVGLESAASQMRKRISQGAEGVRDKIKLQIDSSDVDKQFKNIIDNFKKSVSLASGGISSEFKKSVEQGEILKRTLNDNKKHLENMLAEAKKLHATGLVDASKEIEEIQKILNKMGEFKSEFKEIQKLANFFDLAKAEENINKFQNNISKLQSGIVEKLQAPPQLNEKSNIYDLQKAKDNLNVIENLEKQFVKEREKIIKEISNLEKQSEKIRLEMTKQTNKEVIESLNTVQNELQNKADRLKTLISDAVTPDTSKLKNDISATADRIKAQISNSLKDLSKEPEKVFANIDKQYKEINSKYEKLSKKRFVSKEAVKEFQNGMRQVQDSVDKYNQEIDELRRSIEKLQKLQKMGLAPNSGADLERLRSQLAEMRSHVNTLGIMKAQAIKKSEFISNQASKGLFGHGMEMIRNFRWQVAGLIYLTTKAINTVKNTFFKVIEDIQKFRTDALSIAASISYSLLGNMSENFNNAFLYSKDLMQKLEMEAAKTILTLEDMTMLTKTFAQAGIIPKTDEDVRKISTIGTAIKILTEGMANAGVQMRQELYAIIQGRQRAVDQVATMFKMIGININDMLQKAKKEGKSLIDVLSEALRPFEEVNKAMAHDYSVQLEALDKIWAKIKRIGGDNTYKEISATLERINDSLAKMEEGQLVLTKTGREVAAYVGMVMESVRLLVKSISNMTSGLTRSSEAAKPLFGLFKSIARTAAMISIIVDSIGTGINFIVSRMTGLVAAAVTLATDGPKAAWNVLKEVKKDTDKMWDDFINRSGDLSVEVENSIRSIDAILNGTIEKTTGLMDNFKLPNTGIIDEFSKIGDQLNKAKLAALGGVEKINEEYKQEIEKYKVLKEDIIENVNAINVAMSKTNDKEQKKKFADMLQGHKEAMDDILEYEKYITKERDRKLFEHFEKERQKIISIKAEYEGLLESLEVSPKSPLEQAEKKYDKVFITINKFIEQNKKYFVQAGVDIRKIWDAFNKGAQESVEEATDRMKMAYESFYDSMTSHDVLSPFERIDNEFKKIQNNIMKSNDLLEEDREKLLALIPALKEKRKQLEMITLELEKQRTLTETARGKNEFLKLSIRPIDQQRAALNDLQYDYEDKVNNIVAKIDEIQKKWNNTSDFGEASVYEIQISSLQERLKDLEKLLNIHKGQIQEPFWNDLKEMSQGWFDGFADVLNEAAFNLDSFSENFRNFMTEIAREASRAWIKRNVTDNLMNLLPSFSGEKKEGETKKQIVETMKSGWETVSKMFKDGFSKFVEISGKGFDMLKSGLASIFETISSLFTKENMSAAWGVIAGIGSSVAGMFGGGATKAMAEGGVIQEPIIGRGLRSGTSYLLGEKEDEVVIPMSKMGSSSPNMLSINVPVNVSGGTDNKMIARLKDELRKSVEETTLRVIKEHS